MDKTNALRISITAVLIYVAFVKLNDCLSVLGIGICARLDIINPIAAVSVQIIASIISLAILLGLYNRLYRGHEFTNQNLIVLTVLVGVLVLTLGLLNYGLGDFLASSAPDHWSLVYLEQYGYSNTVGFVTPIVTLIIFTLKLRKEKTVANMV